jgi:hypothetical protein
VSLKLFDCAGRIREIQCGVVLERRAIVGVTHDPLRYLRGHTGSGQVGTERRTHGVEIDYSSLFILGDYPLLGSPVFPRPNQDLIATIIEGRHLTCQTGPKEVFTAGGVGDGLRKHTVPRFRSHCGQMALEFVGKFGMNGYQI